MDDNFDYRGFVTGETSDNARPEGIFPLSRQSSVYSLTFDEFQISTGKDFGSMNMDELLKNIWSAEDSDYNNAGSTSGEYIQRQGSLKLPQTLSQKTVDDVWRDILNDQCGGGVNKDAANLGISSMMQMGTESQPTLGETTLEEFLMKSGVMREETHKPEPPPSSSFGFFGNLSSQPVNNSDAGFLHQQVGSDNRNSVCFQSTTTPGLHLQQHQLRVPSSNNRLGVLHLGTNGVTIAAGSPFLSSNVNGLTRKTDEGAAAASPVTAVPYTHGRARKTATWEKMVERRHRRMIKNRESAARSRARKRAYTMELEAEVIKLKEANEFLVKKQAELREIRKKQVLEMLNRRPKIIKRRCLRRSLTGVW